MSPTILIATSNLGKLREFRRALSPLGIAICGLQEAGISLEVVEDRDSFEGNATKKAQAIAAIADPSLWVLADDSGLCVDALGGAPGVRSARFAGEGASDAENNAKLLKELEGREDRGARFVCALALDDRRALRIICGEVQGAITTHPRGSQGFGYDPLFVPRLGSERPGEAGKTMAELSAEEKLACSHRGAAIQQLVALLQRA